MQCPSCEAEVIDGSRFCPYCGLHLRSVDGGQEPTRTVATVDAPTRPAEPEPDLLTCPRCGAPNSQRRVLCGRCGADLGSGHEGVAPRRIPTRPTDVGPDQREPTRSRARRASWIAVVVLGALIGSGIGAAAWLRSDSDGPGSDPVPTFEPGLYAVEPEPLDVASASASSQLQPEGSISYEPALAVDGDPDTAWNEGSEGTGEGEELRLELVSDAWVKRLIIRNGYQKDDRTFFDNTRASRLLVRFGERSFVVDLRDEMGEQAITLPEPVRTSTITVEVLDVVPGEQYDDLAISEVRVVGWPAGEPSSG